jgi:formylmethanofuran dehydrogenase subunit C
VTGELIPGFDSDGIVTSNPSPESDMAISIAVDSSNIYIAGFDHTPGDVQWRIEKRNKNTGALASAFGTGGVVSHNPSSGVDRAFSIVVDQNYIYVAGFDKSPGDVQWRIAKRDKATGDLVAEFDTDGVVVSNPSVGKDMAISIAEDEEYIYIAGIDNSPGNGQWRVEKRDKTTGQTAATFDSDGILESDVSDVQDLALSIEVDENFIYIAGTDISPGNVQWRIEKRDKITGGL